MNLTSFGGRKFLLTSVSGLGTVILVLLGKIDAATYATVTIATVGAYITGNVTQKWKEGKDATAAGKD